MGKGRPQDLQLNGDTATAKVGKGEVKFAKLNNKWFVRVTE